MSAGVTNKLILAPGASITGTVSGGNTIGSSRISTLALQSDTGVGTLSGLGLRYIDFAQVTLYDGARWTLSGANTVAAGVSVLVSIGATLTAAGSLTNAGQIEGQEQRTALYLAASGVLTNSGTITGGVGGPPAAERVAPAGRGSRRRREPW